MSNGAAAALAAQAAAINALKAYGTIVLLEPRSFIDILSRSERPLVVHTTGGVFRTVHKYLIPYRGLVFYSKFPSPIRFHEDVELVEAGKFWIPNM